MPEDSYYNIMRDKLLLSDSRFDQYRRESVGLFSDIDLGMDGFRISDEEKEVLNKSVNKTMSDLDSVLNSDEQKILNGIFVRKLKDNKKMNNLDIAIENCRHKMQAVNYSFSLIENEIKNLVPPVYEKLPMNLSETEFINDVILFEFESFLMQVYSSLDVLIHLLKIFYPCLDGEEWIIGFRGGQKAGEKTIASLRASKGVKERKLADLFETEIDNWIDEVHKLRNMVAHRSKVYSLQLFVLDNRKKILRNPQLPSGTDMFEYCKMIKGNLLSLFKKISLDFLPHVSL